jgi:hypothetical protein
VVLGVEPVAVDFAGPPTAAPTFSPAFDGAPAPTAAGMVRSRPFRVVHGQRRRTPGTSFREGAPGGFNPLYSIQYTS